MVLPLTYARDWIQPGEAKVSISISLHGLCLPHPAKLASKDNVRDLKQIFGRTYVYSRERKKPLTTNTLKAVFNAGIVCVSH